MGQVLTRGVGVRQGGRGSCNIESEVGGRVVWLDITKSCIETVYTSKY